MGQIGTRKKIQTPPNSSTQTEGRRMPSGTHTKLYICTINIPYFLMLKANKSAKQAGKIHYGHPPHKPLGNISPKVFNFDEVLYYRTDKVRRNGIWGTTLERVEGFWARFSTHLCDGKKLKAQLLCSVPGIQLTLATGQSLIVSFQRS